MRTLLRSFVLLALAPAAAAQIVIHEVLYDPVGPDAGLERIELRNVGAGGQSLAGWTLGICYPGTIVDNRTYWPFPAGKSLGPGEIAVIHYLQDGTDTPTDWYTGTSGAGFTCVTPPKALHDVVGSVVLFNTTSCPLFTQPASVEDFVQWGNTTHHEVQAGAAGQWPFGTWVPVVSEGTSIAYDGDGDGPADWFADNSPTIGLPNESPGTGTVQPFGTGCAGTVGVPVLDTAGGLLAMGNESFALRLSNALPGAPAVIGLAPNPGALPLFGCIVDIDVATLLLDLGPKTVGASGEALFPMPIPNDPFLLGVPLYLQGAVADPGSPSGIVAFSTSLAAAI